MALDCEQYTKQSQTRLGAAQVNIWLGAYHWTLDNGHIVTRVIGVIVSNIIPTIPVPVP